MVARAPVPCGSCSACCRGDAIVLHPECGDDVSAYEHTIQPPPLTGKPAAILKQVDGHCIYLVDGKCSIWDHSPVICREFDCRRMYLKVTRPDRRRLVKMGLFDKAVFDAGRARLHTLNDEAA